MALLSRPHSQLKALKLDGWWKLDEVERGMTEEEERCNILGNGSITEISLVNLFHWWWSFTRCLYSPFSPRSNLVQLFAFVPIVLHTHIATAPVHSSVPSFVR